MSNEGLLGWLAIKMTGLCCLGTWLGCMNCCIAWSTPSRLTVTALVVSSSYVCVYIQLLHTVSILMPPYAARATEGSVAILLWQMLMLFFGCGCLFLFPICAAQDASAFIYVDYPDSHLQTFLKVLDALWCWLLWLPLGTKQKGKQEGEGEPRCKWVTALVLSVEFC